MRGRAEIVLPVDGRVEPIRARLDCEAVRVTEPPGDDSQTGAVGPDGEDRRAPRVPLDADVAGRAVAQVEATVASETTVSCWCSPNGSPLTTTRWLRSADPRRTKRLSRPCSETNSVRPRQTRPSGVRRPRATTTGFRDPRARDDEQPGVLGHVQAAVRPPRHRGRVAGGRRRTSTRRSRRHRDLHRRRARGRSEQRRLRRRPRRG